MDKEQKPIHYDLTGWGVTIKEINLPGPWMHSYEQIMDEVPITNWGRGYVCSVFTLCLLRRRPTLVIGILRYWAHRLWKRVYKKERGDLKKH